MPSYPLTLPASPAWRSVKAKPLHATVRSESPYTYQSKAADWMGESSEFDFELPLMKEGDLRINEWIQFFMDLRGPYGTFTADLTRYLPGQLGYDALTLALASDMSGWNVPVNLTFGFRFRARIAK